METLIENLKKQYEKQSNHRKEEIEYNDGEILSLTEEISVMEEYQSKIDDIINNKGGNVHPVIQNLYRESGIYYTSMDKIGNLSEVVERLEDLNRDHREWLKGDNADADEIQMWEEELYETENENKRARIEAAIIHLPVARTTSKSSWLRLPFSSRDF